MLQSELENTHDRALSVWWTLVQRRPERSVEVASRLLETGSPEYIGREVVLVTDHETIMVFR